MKKKMLFLAPIILIGIFSCKKDMGDASANAGAPILTVETLSSQPQIAGTKKVLGTYKLKVGNMDEFTVGVDLTIGGTVPFSDIKKVYYVATSATDSLSSPQLSVPSSGLIEYDWEDLYSKNTEYTITVYGDVKDGTLGQIATKMKIWYFWSGTTNQNGDLIPEVSGQTTSFVIHLNPPKVTSSSSSAVTVVNGEFVVLNEVFVKASSTSPMATKQLSWRFSFSNNSGAGTMRFDSLRLFFRGEDVTTKWKLIDSLGVEVNSISQSSPAKKVHAVAITGDGEVVTLQGNEDDFELKGIVRGFGGDSVISDVATILAVNDVSPMPIGYVYLNKGTGSTLHAKLFNSGTPSSSAKVANIVWSPMVFSPHTAHYGGPCPDWYSGYGIIFVATPTVLHS